MFMISAMPKRSKERQFSACFRAQEKFLDTPILNYYDPTYFTRSRCYQEPPHLKRKPLGSMGQLQTAIMEIVWELREATVQQVRDRLAEEKPLAYTTVLSAMQKLEKSGWLTHRNEGRAYVYLPNHSREDAGQSALRQFVGSVFSGDPLALFKHLLADETLSKEDLAEIQGMIDRARKERQDD
jgi:BlaI family penicillinase repressor